jgi:hypothetical protein
MKRFSAAFLMLVSVSSCGLSKDDSAFFNQSDLPLSRNIHSVGLTIDQGIYTFALATFQNGDSEVKFKRGTDARLVLEGAPKGDATLDFRAACLNSECSEILLTVNQGSDTVTIHVRDLGAANCNFKIATAPAESWSIHFDSVTLAKYEGSDRWAVSLGTLPITTDSTTSRSYQMNSALSQPSDLEFVESFSVTATGELTSQRTMTIGKDESVRWNAAGRNLSLYDSLGIPGESSMSCNY